jgi:hypothetical protein
MKAYGGSGGTEPSFLNSGSLSSLPGHLLLRPNKESADGINWTDGSIGHYHVRASEIISCPCQKSNQGSSIYQPLATSLYRAFIKDWVGRSAISTQFIFPSNSTQQRHRTTRDLVYTNLIAIHNLARIGISWYLLFSKCYIFMTTLRD